MADLVPPEKRFDVGNIELQWNEFKMRNDRRIEDGKFCKAFKEAIRKQVGAGTEFWLNGAQVASYDLTEKFKSAEFQKENPDMWEQYLVPRVVKEFDEERFRRENPAMWEQYRTASFNFK